MNNLEAYNLLKSFNNNANDATSHFLEIFQIPQTEYQHFRYFFKGLNSQRLVVRKRGDLDSWNVSTFFRAENDIIEQTLCKDSPSFQSRILTHLANKASTYSS